MLTKCTSSTFLAWTFYSTMFANRSCTNWFALLWLWFSCNRFSRWDFSHACENLLTKGEGFKSVIFEFSIFDYSGQNRTFLFVCPLTAHHHQENFFKRIIKTPPKIKSPQPTTGIRTVEVFENKKKSHTHRRFNIWCSFLGKNSRETNRRLRKRNGKKFKICTCKKACPSSSSSSSSKSYGPTSSSSSSSTCTCP